MYPSSPKSWCNSRCSDDKQQPQVKSKLESFGEQEYFLNLKTQNRGDGP